MSIKHTLIASTLMCLTMIFLYYIGHTENIHPNNAFSTFPKQIGEWHGREDRFDQEVYDLLGVDDSFLCHYRDTSGRYVQLYIGFYQSQREGDLIHSPKNCMPGGGWNITFSALESLPIPATNSDGIKVVKLILQNGIQKQVMLYWYQSRGRIINSEYLQKIYLVVDSIFLKRTDGSFVRLISPVINDDEKTALNALKEFSVELFPILNQYIPS